MTNSATVGEKGDEHMYDCDPDYQGASNVLRYRSPYLFFCANSPFC